MKLQKMGIGVLIVGSAFLLAACNKVNNPSQPATTGASQSSTAGAVVIVYAKDGFSPNTLKTKVGQQIIIMNTSGATIQFNSDPHPVHTSFPELNLGTIATGESKTLTLSKVGTYTYHNHLSPQQKGTIVVE